MDVLIILDKSPWIWRLSYSKQADVDLTGPGIFRSDLK